MEGLNPEIVAALQAVGRAPNSARVQLAFFKQLATQLNSSTDRMVRQAMAQWFEACAPGRPARAVDYLAGAVLSPEALRFAATMMVQTGFPAESIETFSHSCQDLAETAAQDHSFGGVESKFADLAGDYDSRNVHGIVADQFYAFLETAGRFSPDARALDVGCGTGLVAAKLRPKVGILDGIDIAPAMAEKAREKGIYDSLAVGEAAEVMGRPDRRGRYDLIFSNWCLFYLPDLRPFFRSAAAAAAPGGQVVFTVYPCRDECDVMCKESGIEYAHSLAYLKRLGAENGLVEERVETRVLCNHPGYYCVFKRPL